MTTTPAREAVDAAFASALPGYEHRPQQAALSAAIEDALSTGAHLLAEAGCGTGKSFGYLIPAILSGKRVIVATATKALQDQIASKDLPFLQTFFEEQFGVQFEYAVLKGRSNYLCRDKANDADPSDVPSLASLLSIIEARDAEVGFVAERDQFGITVTDKEWRAVTAGPEECPGKKDCPFGEVCFAERAKGIAKKATIVVVNHALLFTDLAIRAKTNGVVAMLDNYDVVIFDEAHEAEEYASSVFGDEISEASIRALSAEVRNFSRQNDPESIGAVEDAIHEVTGSAARLWKVLVPGTIREATIVECSDEYVAFYEALTNFVGAIGNISLEKVPSALIAKARGRKERLLKRGFTAAEKVQDIIVLPESELVRWVEVRQTRREGEVRILKFAPVDVSHILRPLLFGTTQTILVSATLEVDGGFDYIAGRLGIDSYTGLNVGTPFDFAKQSLFYVPTDLPDPTPQNRAKWETAAIQRTADLVKASDGRALLLFTSTKQMDSAYETLSDFLPYTCLKQGQKPNRALAADFLADTHSVLFATRSFFTGVDFQGEACSLVVIDKLPFPVPTEALFQARCEAVEAKGGNPFSAYTIPLMALILKQGHGRLIRHRNDRGVFALLDPRVKTKGYGTKIVRSLPDSTFTTSLEDVRSFFAEEVVA